MMKMLFFLPAARFCGMYMMEMRGQWALEIFRRHGKFPGFQARLKRISTRRNKEPSHRRRNEAPGGVGLTLAGLYYYPAVDQWRRLWDQVERIRVSVQSIVSVRPWL